MCEMHGMEDIFILAAYFHVSTFNLSHVKSQYANEESMRISNSLDKQVFLVSRLRITVK